MKMLQTIALVTLGWTAACGGAQREAQMPQAEPAPSEQHFEDGEANPAPQAEEVADERQDLTTATRAFDRALEAEELSCTAAKSHVAAICQIAERICDVSARQPASSARPQDCDEARADCVRSQDRYAERCGE